MKKFFIILAVLMLTTAQINVVYGEELPTLKLQDAVSKAISHSTQLGTIKDNIEKLEDDRTDLGMSLNDTSGTNNLNTLLSIVQADMNRALYQMQEEQQKETISFSVKRLYIGILNSENELELNDKSLDISRKELNISTLKAKLGTISESQLQTEKLAYEKLLKDRESLAFSLEEAYTSLNLYIGEKATKRYKLVMDDINYIPLGNVDIDYQVALKMVDDPNVITAQKNYEMAKRTLDLYNEGSNRSYTDLQKDVSKAARNITDEKEKLDEKMRSAYNSIVTLQNQIYLNQMELKKSEDDLKVYELKFGHGTISELELVKFKYSVESLQNKIMSQITDHYLKLIQFDKPYLM